MHSNGWGITLKQAVITQLYLARDHFSSLFVDCCLRSFGAYCERISSYSYPRILWGGQSLFLSSTCNPRLVFSGVQIPWLSTRWVMQYVFLVASHHDLTCQCLVGHWHDWFAMPVLPDLHQTEVEVIFADLIIISTDSEHICMSTVPDRMKQNSWSKSLWNQLK